MVFLGWGWNGGSGILLVAIDLGVSKKNGTPKWMVKIRVPKLRTNGMIWGVQHPFGSNMILWLLDVLFFCPKFFENLRFRIAPRRLKNLRVSYLEVQDT